MYIQDDDPVLDDSRADNGQTLDLSQQTLALPFGPYPAGRLVQSINSYTVTNATTGQIGIAYSVRIYTGTNPSSPGSQWGQYYNIFTIPVKAGDVITYA